MWINIRAFFQTTTLIVCIFSCRKSSPSIIQEMEYQNLNNQEVRYQNPSVVIDIDKDNTPDLSFGVILVGDPVNHVDKKQFNVTSGVFTRLPVNIAEEVPVLNSTENIPINNFKGYTWYEISNITLIQRTESNTGSVSWQGLWKNALKNYLPVQVIRNNQPFNGWIEVSTDLANEKIILHRAAISKAPGKEVVAGR